jgi:hypothetical protein
MLMRTTSAEIGEDRPAFPSAGRMFAIGIPFWLTIVGGSALSHTLRGWQWELQYLPTDVALIIGGAGIGAGVYAFLRRNTGLSFNRQIAAAFLLIMVIAIPTESMLRGVKLFNPLAQPRPAFESIQKVPGPNGEVRHKIIRIPAEPRTAAEMFQVKDLVRGGMFWLAILSLWAAMCIATLRDREARHRERRMAALQAEAHDAQVRALRYQVNPHFPLQYAELDLDADPGGTERAGRADDDAAFRFLPGKPFHRSVSGRAAGRRARAAAALPGDRADPVRGRPQGRI